MGVGSKIAVALGAPGTRKGDAEGLQAVETEVVGESAEGNDGENGRSKKRVRLGEDRDVSMTGAETTNGMNPRISTGSAAQDPQIIDDDSDGDDADEGMGSEAGDSVPNSGSDTESVYREELEDEEVSEGVRDGEEEEEEDDDDMDSLIGARRNDTEEDSGEEGHGEG